MNANLELAQAVNRHIQNFLDVYETKSQDAIKAAYDQAIESLDSFKAQHPTQFKLLRDTVITESFADTTDFRESAESEPTPYEVYIPDASDTLIPLRKNIVLIGGTMFKEDVETQLTLLEATSVGKRLIEKIGKFSHTVFIMAHRGDECRAHVPKNASTKGVGSSCTLKLSYNAGSYISSDIKEVEYPKYCVLAHELIHAYHIVQGKFFKEDPCLDKMIWGNDEEYYTIMGYPSKKTERTIPKISENALLRELGLPMRITHSAAWKINAFEYSRLRLFQRMFERASQNFTPSQRICPPVAQVSHKDLEPSTIVVRVFKLARGDLWIYRKASECEESFVWRHIPVADLTPKICGPHADGLLWVSDMRLSLIEAAAFQRMIQAHAKKSAE